MTHGDAEGRVGMPATTPEGSGRNPREHGAGASNATARRAYSRPETQRMMEAVVERGNMTAALRRVVANKGSAGVDGMPVEALKLYLKAHWPRIKEQLLAGGYEPAPVRMVEIPKRGAKGCDSWASLR